MYVSAVSKHYSPALPDEGAGQEADQAHRTAGHRRHPAAEDVGEDADDGRAEEDHAHGEGAHPGCRTTHTAVLEQQAAGIQM